MIVWPLALIILGLFLALFGMTAAFGGGYMAAPTVWEERLVLLFPIGVLMAIAGIVWLVILLIARWLA